MTPFAALAHKQPMNNFPLLIRLLKALGPWHAAGRDIATWKVHICFIHLDSWSRGVAG